MTSPFTKTLPSGPESSATAQMQEWLEHPLEMMDQCVHKYGDTFTIQLGSLGTTVFFSHPEAIKKIFSLSPRLFECHQYNETYRYLMGDNALFLQDGMLHKQKRRLVMPAFHGERIAKYAQLICQITKQVTQQWSVDEAFCVRPFMHEIALQVILQTVFGSQEATVTKLLSRLFKTQIMRDFGTWSPWARLGQLRSQISQLIFAEIRRRRSNPDVNSPDVLNLLLSANYEDGEQLSDEEIRDHIFSFLVAGVDPTGVGLTWSLYWLHQKNDVKNKVQQELASLGDNPDPLAIAKLPYLTAVCQESLRICSVLATPSGRKLTEDVEIQGQTMPAGTTLVPCIYLLHRREDIYPQPNEFRPERFLEHRFSANEYIPFGGGNRICIGAALAKLEMNLVLATILSDWELEDASEEKITTVRHGTVLAPSEQMKLICKNKK